MSPYSAQATWTDVDYGVEDVPFSTHDAGFTVACEADRIVEEIRERDARRCAELNRMRGRWGR